MPDLGFTADLPYPFSIPARRRLRSFQQEQQQEYDDRQNRLAGAFQREIGRSSEGMPFAPLGSAPSEQPQPIGQPQVSGSMRMRMLMNNPELASDFLAAPDFFEKLKAMTGEDYTLKPNEERFSGGERIAGNPLAQVTSPGQAQRDPRTGALISQNDYAPQVVGEGSALTQTGKGGTRTLFSQPKTYAPGTGQPKPVDPILDATRRASLRAKARAEVLDEQGITEVPGYGIVDTSTGRLAVISADRQKQVNDAVEQRVREYTGSVARNAPTIDSPAPAALPPRTMPDDSAPWFENKGAAPDDVLLEVVKSQGGASATTKEKVNAELQRRGYDPEP